MGCTVAELTNPTIRAARYWEAMSCRMPVSVSLQGHGGRVDNSHNQGCQVLGGGQLQDACLSVPERPGGRHVLSRLTLRSVHGSCLCVSTKHVSSLQAQVLPGSGRVPRALHQQLHHRSHLGGFTHSHLDTAGPHTSFCLCPKGHIP